MLIRRVGLKYGMTNIKMPRKPARKRVPIGGKWYSAKGVELTRNGGWETEAEHMAKIRSALRGVSRFWKPALKALEGACRPYTGANKRIKKEYQCVNCSMWYVRAKVEINHVVPCGTLKCYNDVPQFLTNMFVENSKGYEVLCKECHKLETKQQRESRK